MTSIVLADDHRVVRQGLRALLEAESDFKVVGEASDGLETLELIERHQPNIAIIDIMMPAMSGLEVTRRISQQFPDTRVIVLSMYADESYVQAALKNNAWGYVLKEATSVELVDAIRIVLSGRRYLCPPLTERAIAAYAQKGIPETGDPYETLTNREREVLHLSAEGYNNPEIAARLSISPRTAETHRANVMRKLGIRNQTDLVRYAIKKGILPME